MDKTVVKTLLKCNINSVEQLMAFKEANPDIKAWAAIKELNKQPESNFHRRLYNVAKAYQKRAADKLIEKEKILTAHSFKPVSSVITSPNWLVKGVLQDNEFGLIFGPSGEKKSFVVLDMALHASNGVDWSGHKVKKPVKVLYLAGEGFGGISRRLTAASKYHGLPTDNILVSETPGDLSDEKSVEAIALAIEQFDAPVWLIIDTLHRNFGNADENSSRDMGNVISNIDKILKPTGVTTTVIHHTGHGNTNRERGSSALMAAVDTKIKVSTDSRTGITEIECHKMKDAECFAPVNMESQIVVLGEDEDNDLITSIAMIPTEKEADKKVDQIELMAEHIYNELPLDNDHVNASLQVNFNIKESTAANKKTAIKKYLSAKYKNFKTENKQWTKDKTGREYNDSTDN